MKKYEVTHIETIEVTWIGEVTEDDLEYFSINRCKKGDEDWIKNRLKADKVDVKSVKTFPIELEE